MMIPALAYLILCIAVGVYGSERTLGFWGFFPLALIFTPFVIFLFLVLTRTKTSPKAR